MNKLVLAAACGLILAGAASPTFAHADTVPGIDVPVVQPLPDMPAAEKVAIADTYTPPAPVKEATAEGWWLMPEGATDTNVLWPQTFLPDQVVECGRWAQVDTYVKSELEKFAADGILTEGEDYASGYQTGAISWRFVYGGDCAPVVPECGDGTVVTPVEGGYVCEPVVVALPTDVGEAVTVVAPVADTSPDLLASTGVNEEILPVALWLVGLGGLAVAFGALRRIRHQ